MKKLDINEHFIDQLGALAADLRTLIPQTQIVKAITCLEALSEIGKNLSQNNDSLKAYARMEIEVFCAGMYAKSVDVLTVCLSKLYYDENSVISDEIYTKIYELATYIEGACGD